MKKLAYHPPAAVAKLKRADPQLAALIARVGKFSLAPRPAVTPFDSLLQAIVYQQLSGRAAAAIHARLRALYPRNRPLPRHVAATVDGDLRAAGLSWAKVAAVKDLAQKTLAGTVPSNRRLRGMDDEEIIQRLCEVRGVGRWTVEMLLIFHQGRPDVLPLDDLGIRKGFKYAFNLRKAPDAKRLGAHGERWRPYRSVASWYLWRAVDLHEGPRNRPD